MLDGVPVAAPVALLHDVTGLGEVGDDGEGAALRDVERVGHVAQPEPRIVRDAEQYPRVVGEKAPLRHARDASNLIPVFSC